MIDESGNWRDETASHPSGSVWLHSATIYRSCTTHGPDLKLFEANMSNAKALHFQIKIKFDLSVSLAFLAYQYTSDVNFVPTLEEHMVMERDSK